MIFVEKTPGGIIVVKVTHSEATLRYAMEFRNTITDLMLAGKYKIVVDLSETTFMDSTFLGVLVFSLKKTIANGGGMTLIRSRNESPVWTMFELTNMVKVFKIFEEPKAALASFELK